MYFPKNVAAHGSREGWYLPVTEEESQACNLHVLGGELM